MRQIYLIAQREFLGYVATWGFWISLLLIPVFMSLGALFPLVVERSEPVRYYAVVTDDPRLEMAIEERAERLRRQQVRTAIEAAGTALGGAGEVSAALAAFDAAPDLDAAMQAAAAQFSLPPEVTAALNASQGKTRKVPAPARDPEALRPYLLGETLIETDEGPRPLHAAAFLSRGGDGVIMIDYWSANLTSLTGSQDIRAAMRDLMREEAFSAEGVSPELVERVRQLQPELRELTPARATGDAQVTLADRLPYFVSFVLGFALWMVLFSVVNVLLTSVIEEKSSKVLETLLASARMHEILAGKLLGVAAVSATLVLVWGGVGVGVLLAASVSGVGLPDGLMAAILDPGLLIPFAIYFVFGYLMYGAVFLAIGSLCESIQEAQTLMSPMMIVLMVPVLGMVMAISNPEGAVVKVLSWIPIYTPFVMIQRLPTEPPLWELVATSALLVVVTIGLIRIAGGVFRAGATGSADASSVGAWMKGLTKRKAAAEPAE